MGGGGENGELLFNGYRISVWEDEKVLEMDSGDGCTTMQMYIVTLNYASKMIKMVKFCHVYFTIKN